VIERTSQFAYRIAHPVPREDRADDTLEAR
jgi:hypothetical protein